ncbi:hypothetical protein ACQKM2_26550 [Streptomyces sp. NPDC004126]|uniref:hypothetical protein n=1 Tax=Streptomyces sp. NPDC004126 TaxID=3390695 RepID=UPI003CFF21B8
MATGAIMIVCGGFGAVWIVWWTYGAAPGQNRWLGGWALFLWCLLVLALGVDLLRCGRGLLRGLGDAQPRAERIYFIVLGTAALGVAGGLAQRPSGDSPAMGQWLTNMAGFAGVCALALSGVLLTSAKATARFLHAHGQDHMTPVAEELAAEASLGARLGVFSVPDETIYVHEHGAVFFHGLRAMGRPGRGRTFLVRWQEVERFEHGTTLLPRKDGRPGYVYRLRYRGSRHRMAAFAPSDERNELASFARLVDPMIAQARLPRMLTRLHEGRAVDFRTVAVTPDGLLLYDWILLVRFSRHLSWSAIDHVELVPPADARTGFVVHARGTSPKRVARDPAGVPDQAALFGLLGHFGVDVRRSDRSAGH